jgi:excisionase family DNA binding protein
VPAKACTERRVLGIPEVAERLGLFRETVRRAILRGELPAVQVGRQWLVPVEVVERIESGEGPRPAS